MYWIQLESGNLTLKRQTQAKISSTENLSGKRGPKVEAHVMLLYMSTNSNLLSPNFFIIILKGKLSPNITPPSDFALCAEDVTACSIEPTNKYNHGLAI